LGTAGLSSTLGLVEANTLDNEIMVRRILERERLRDSLLWIPLPIFIFGASNNSSVVCQFVVLFQSLHACPFALASSNLGNEITPE